MTALDPIATLLQRVTTQLQQQIASAELTNPVIIGIHTGGVYVAEHIHQQLQLNTSLHSLNIHLYRDDFTQIGLHPTVEPTSIDTNLDNKDVVLVDDVLMTGRTIRAAMNELFDFGRPAKVRLLTLIDAQRRELPIQPDIFGQRLALSAKQYVELTGPEPLQLQLIDKETKAT